MTQPLSSPDHLDDGVGLERVHALTTAVRENVRRAIVGKDDAIDLLVVALLAGGHVLIEDVPGTGKTTLAKAFAQSLGYDFRRIQFTPDLVPADVLGVNVYDPRDARFGFRPGPVFTHVLLADENAGAAGIWPAAGHGPSSAGALALYYDVVRAAMRRGYEPAASQTPRERVGDLSAMLPGVPVGEITERFNAACYGGRDPIHGNWRRFEPRSTRTPQTIEG